MALIAVKKDDFMLDAVLSRWVSGLAINLGMREWVKYTEEDLERLKPQEIDELLKTSVDNSLAALNGMESGNVEKVKLAKIRKFYETFMAWVIARDVNKRRRAKFILKMILNAGDSISMKDVKIGGEESWFEDAEFHRQICYISERSNLSWIVDRVYEICSFAKPRSDEDVKQTWLEHRQIVDAILNDHANEDVLRMAIQTAVWNHIDKAGDRWDKYYDTQSVPVLECTAGDNRSLNASNKQEADNAMKGISMQDKDDGAPSFVVSVPDDVCKSAEAFRRDHDDLVNGGHMGEWVVYRKGVRIGFANTKNELFHQHNINPESDRECYYAMVLQEDLSEE